MKNRMEIENVMFSKYSPMCVKNKIFIQNLKVFIL